MFELSVACKYLIPRRRQLSVSIISLISILVIALVVWLIVVFFSVTDGLEKNWVQKLTALTAPVRITPTDAYTHSYYSLVDTISDASNYSPKTIREKLDSPLSDPYNPEIDEEIPTYWAPPDRHPDGSLKDLVKLVYASLKEVPGVPGLHGQDFELTATHIQLRLLRRSAILHASNVYGGTTQSALSYPAYLGNFESQNPHLETTLLPIESQDLNNLLSLMGTGQSTSEEGEERVYLPPEILQTRLKNFFTFAHIKQLQGCSAGWNIPHSLLPKTAQWEVCPILSEEHVVKIFVPPHAQQQMALQKTLEEQGLSVTPGRLTLKEGAFLLQLPGEEPRTLSHPTITLAGENPFNVQLESDSMTSSDASRISLAITF